MISSSTSKDSMNKPIQPDSSLPTNSKNLKKDKKISTIFLNSTMPAESAEPVTLNKIR